MIDAKEVLRCQEDHTRDMIPQEGQAGLRAVVVSDPLSSIR